MHDFQANRVCSLDFEQVATESIISFLNEVSEGFWVVRTTRFRNSMTIVTFPIAGT